MKSPFPGMDPYLEAHWGDVHTSLVTYARDQLQAQMPANLKVRVVEYVAVEAEENGHSKYVPDVRVIEHPSIGSGGAAVAEMDVAEPLLCLMVEEPVTQRWIRIIDTQSGNRVVTAIEFLSPANKSRAGLRTYRKKRKDLRAAGVNLVEIDLLRGGRYMVAVPRKYVRRDYQGPYRICVVRACRPNIGEVYRATFRERLPTIRIPLRPSDLDARLKLQSLIDAAYECGGYGDTDYLQEADPPLKGDNAVWADVLLREAGRR